MTAATRRQRREAELAARREQRRGRQTRRSRQAARGGLPIVPLTLAGLGIGLLAVLAWAFLLQPPAAGPELEAPLQPAPYALQDGQALGDADAPLTIEIWSDYQCPVCATLAETYEPRLIADYVRDGDVRIVYRDYAFLGPESIDAAVAARVAGREGMYWQYHDYLMANQEGENRGAFSRDRLAEIAVTIGLDRADFLAALDDPALRQAVAAETAQGQQLGVVSTPTLMVGSQPIVGLPRTYEDLTRVVEAMLAQAQP